MIKTVRDQGVSLLELVAVLAIFSLVSVMALQLLTGGLGARTRIAQTHDALPGVIAALAVLRRDLELMQPVSDGGFQMRPNQLSVASRGDTGERTRIDWRLEAEGSLTRRVVPVGQDAADVPAMVMMRGVSEWKLEPIEPAGQDRPGGAPSVPRGVSVSLVHADLGELHMVAAR